MHTFVQYIKSWSREKRDAIFNHQPREDIVMNKDQVEGRVDQAKGKIKEVAGRVVGNKELEAEGNVDQASGKVQSTYGDTKEKAKDAVKTGADKL